MLKPYSKTITINKKVKFDYNIIKEYDAGLKLSGSEVKSIRLLGANIKDSFCVFINNELFCDFNIPKAITVNKEFDSKRHKKLLLNKKELIAIKKQIAIKGNTVVPYILYNSEHSFLKLKIIIGTGKTKYDKRETLKEKDFIRESKRIE